MSVWPSAQRPVTASRGLVVTSQPLACQAGLKVLKEGGNAVDAAVTAAATLAVVEPTMTGIGGDLFATVWMERDKSVHAINASGRAPATACLDPLKKKLPDVGIFSVTVPGAVDGWNRLLNLHGTIPFSRALAPAIEHAQSGFKVTPIVARQWQECQVLLSRNPAAIATYLPNGRAPRAGEVFANPLLARTLEQLVKEGAETFYDGPMAWSIVSALAPLGEWLEASDLAAHAADWVTPRRTMFRGYDVLELPPNTQGITALEILNLIEPDVDACGPHNGPEYCHLLAESIRVAMIDRDAYIADPSAMRPGVVDELISTDYALTRRGEIDPQHATKYAAIDWRSQVPAASAPNRGDTVYLAVVDSDGNAVSLVQSLFGAFGSGVVAGNTGIVLQNRGSLFSSDATHPNCLAPGKRSLYTLIPALVMKNGRPWLVYGVTGGDMQPQGHAQVLANMAVFGMDVQAAGSAPRLRWTEQGVALEQGFPEMAREGLAQRGHPIIDKVPGFGGFHGICFESKTGLLLGGSDPRKDGMALGY